MLHYRFQRENSLLYGCETWRTTKKIQEKIQTFVIRCLRTIYRIRWLDKVPNEGLCQSLDHSTRFLISSLLIRYKDQEPMAKQIVRRKWSWRGHSMRKDNTSITRQALTWNSHGKKKREFPRNS